jgi:hypothetical protein
MVFILFLVSVFSCKKQQTVFEINTTEMTDAQYPDNPNLDSRHSEAQQKFFKKIILKKAQNNKFELELISHENLACTLTIKNLPLMEMMPTAPEYIKKDDYLTYIGIINQEWNRQQVQFTKGQFTVKGSSQLKITRVDLARNCLNAYLWEMLIYAKDKDGKDKLFWQCWFDFPADLYKELFEKRNTLDYEKYRKGLENWVDPESKMVNLSVLRKAESEKEIDFTANNSVMYPLKGERLRKQKNIIYPKSLTNMNSFLSDSTQFATFSIPGYYNIKDPRKTELSKLGKLEKVIKRDIKNVFGTPSIELEMIFKSNKDNKTITKLIIGDIDLKNMPSLAVENANEGWMTSMGISNHSFYETFDYQQNHLTKSNGFYAFLVDKNNNWLDSHKIGIDGPLLHFDDKDKSKLHLWILSFERHSFVGHFVLNLKKV